MNKRVPVGSTRQRDTRTQSSTCGYARYARCYRRPAYRSKDREPHSAGLLVQLTCWKAGMRGSVPPIGWSSSALSPGTIRPVRPPRVSWRSPLGLDHAACRQTHLSCGVGWRDRVAAEAVQETRPGTRNTSTRWTGSSGFTFPCVAHDGGSTTIGGLLHANVDSRMAS